jgi:hypothetical protein
MSTFIVEFGVIAFIANDRRLAAQAQCHFL